MQPAKMHEPSGTEAAESKLRARASVQPEFAGSHGAPVSAAMAQSASLEAARAAGRQAANRRARSALRIERAVN